MALHVVIGKGPAGVATTRLLAQRGHQVRVISRTGGTSHGSVEHHALDVTTRTDQVISLTAGANAIYNCGGPPYHRWTSDWPPFAEALLDAAEKAGAVLVLTGNLYAYGPTYGPMTEDLPLAAQTSKGRVRAQVWQTALQRHQDGRVRVVEARSSDFIGPDVTAGGHLAERVVPALLRGRRPRVLGDPTPFTVGPTCLTWPAPWYDSPTDDRAWGRAWHVPTAAPYSTQTAVEQMCRIAGVTPVRASATPWWLLRGLGLFSPTLRELPELSYQFDRPFVIDSTAYSSTFGEEPTPADQALAATVAWWQRRLAGIEPDSRTAEPAAPGRSGRRGSPTRDRHYGNQQPAVNQPPPGEAGQLLPRHHRAVDEQPRHQRAVDGQGDGRVAEAEPSQGQREPGLVDRFLGGEQQPVPTHGAVGGPALRQHGHLLRTGDHAQHPRRQRGMRFRIDAQRPHPIGMRDDRSPVTVAVGHAPDHPVRPARRAGSAAQQWCRREAEPAERFPRAVADRREFPAALGHRTGEYRHLGRKEGGPGTSSNASACATPAGSSRSIIASPRKTGNPTTGVWAPGGEVSGGCPRLGCRRVPPQRPVDGIRAFSCLGLHVSPRDVRVGSLQFESAATRSGQVSGASVSTSMPRVSSSEAFLAVSMSAGNSFSTQSALP